jgi:transposase
VNESGYPLVVLQVAVPRYRCTTAKCGRAVFKSGSRQAGGPAGRHDAAVCPVCVGPVDDRPHHHRGHCRGVGWHVAYRQLHRHACGRRSDRRDRAGTPCRVRVIGVGEHRWAPRRVGAAGFVTLIIDLTPVHDHSGPARLLDMVAGRSATALASWLAAQPSAFAEAVEVIAHGRVRRLQDRRSRGRAECGHGDGPLRCRRPWPGPSWI